MGSEINDLYIEQGSDYFLRMNFTDEAGDILDFSKYTLRGAVSIDNTSVDIPFTEKGNGVVDIEIPALTTQVIPAGVGKYDVELVEDATGEVTRLMKGRAYIDREVTV